MGKYFTYFTIMLLILILVPIGCSTKIEETDKSNHNIDWREYFNAYYKIKCPVKWDQEVSSEYSIDKFNVSFSSSKDTPANKRILFDISIDKDVESLEEFKNFMDEKVKKLKERGFSIKELNEVSIQGQPAQKIIVEKGSINGRFIYIYKADAVFNIKFSGYKDGYNENLKIAKEMIDSFQFFEFESVLFSSLAIEEEWNKYTLEEFEVYYPDDSMISVRVKEWTEKRIEAFNFITNYLGVEWKYGPIKFYVFNSQEQGRKYGLRLGFALPEKNQIFTRHNQSPGHELAHVIVNKIDSGKQIRSPLINEGLATYLDRTGRDYHQLSAQILKRKNYNIRLLGSNFREYHNPDDAYTLGASFISFLIEEYGLDLFKDFFAQEKFDGREAFKHFYGKSGEKLMEEWKDYLRNYS